MPTRIAGALFVLSLLTASARAQDALSVASAQPTGEIASLEQAAEIRVRFSEPMVPIGGLPDQVSAPFFTVRPAIAGTFRWGGPTLLIFTPDPKQPLPTATRYDVTIAATATAVSGRTLAQPYSFSFTTPTVRLLSVTWYRVNGRYDQPAVLALRFNQPVRPADAVAHVTARYERHEWEVPRASQAERARMGADGAARFDAKVTAAAATATSTAAVPLQLAADWDKKRFPPSADLVVLQTQAAPSVEGWLQVSVDTQMPAAQGRATPRAAQRQTVRLERTFFIDPFRCQVQCDADGFNVAVLRVPVALDALRRAASAVDVTDRARETPVPKPATPPVTRGPADRLSHIIDAEDLGYPRQPPSRTYAFSLDANVQASDGQTLGYPWTSIVENWHARAFTSFGDGHGVWETGGGALPFYERNFVDAREWAQAIAPNQLMPTILRLTAKDFHLVPDGAGTRRTLGGESDKILSHGLDLSRMLTPSGTGLAWVAVEHGQPIARSRVYEGSAPIDASIVQVTNLGITVKDSPQNTLVFVTRLDTGAPVGGADVTIVRKDNSTAWTGRTDEYGIALAPQTRIRNPSQPWKFSFIVTAQKDGDVAYVGSDWTEGIEPFEFGVRYDPAEAAPLLRGSVFSDRGVYKPGEEVHVKAILRRDTPSGIQLIPAGTTLHIAVRDSRNKIVDRRTVTMNAWSAAEWTMKVAADGAFGAYDVGASLDRKALDDPPPPPPPSDDPDADDIPDVAPDAIVRGSFVVAAYRRPEFRVDATIASMAPASLAGTPLKATINARYLFGAPMINRPVSWTYSRTPVSVAPAAVLNAFPGDRFVFVGCCDDTLRPADSGQLGAKTATLDGKGQLSLDLDTRPSDGLPYSYSIEGDVEDVSRQHIAGRADVVVHPAPWYVGLQRPPLFVDQKTGVTTAIVTAGVDGSLVAGVKVDVALVEIQWHSVRRAEGNGFYGWETERTEVDKGHFTVTSSSESVPLMIPLPEGGSYTIRATARDGAYRAATRLSFYALGSGYTAWQRYDHNRIDLVPEKDSYKPGETARFMIQSPWEEATALLTVEREGIRSHMQFALTSTQQTVTVPVTAADIPNLFVSVLLVKGRSKADPSEDASDPGKPTFRLGYAKIAVEDASKRLTMSVKANHDEFRPAGSAKIDVQVNDAAGAPASSEVTLWAVDYGVLSLTAFRTPDVLKSVYVPKALQVMTEDNRQRIISRRVLTPKGSDEGGGGGADGTLSQVRKDFRVLAFWLGSVTTDGKGHASADIKLPESLTTYRIMAVAGDKASRFGSGESEIRINKPVVLKGAFPRFMTRGDKGYFGSVVTSQLKEAGTAVVTMKSLDPNIVEIAGDGKKSVQVGAGGSTEVRFDVVAKATGRARIQTTVKLRSESDAFEDVVPVQVTMTPERVASYGEAAPDAKQTVTLPPDILPGVGGLHLELASTALVGLGEGARYVVEYPFGCLEQRASRTLVLAVSGDLGDAFHLPGIDARDLRTRVQSSLRELDRFQCPSGGFSFWPGECLSTSPFLTSYALSVYQTAAHLKYDVDEAVLRGGYDYLEKALGEQPPVNEGWWPAYTAWEAFAIRVLAVGGRHQDSNINRLYRYLDRMPVFALAYLHDALSLTGGAAPRIAELQRRISNAMLPEGGSAHVEELNDPYLLWFFNSNVRSTAVVLNSLIAANAPPADVAPMVRWLLAARQNGRWGNTQENAVAMQALVNYYRKYEGQVPNFTASVRLGTEQLVRATFKGRTTDATIHEVPMATLMKGGTAPRDLTLHRDGEGTLFYAARLTYAPDAATLTAADRGFRVERRYAPFVDGKGGAPATSFLAGDLVQVTLSFDLPKERRYVAVTDPIPAGFEAVESWFATTARDVAHATDQEDGSSAPKWEDIWQRGTFDHVERHDDRVLLFATRLASGHHEFSYIVRATTAGSFQAGPARAEEMYEPEVTGRTATQTIEVKR